jgi:hypothetical protein
MKAARGKFRMGWYGLLFLASVMMFGCGSGGGDDDGGGGGTPPPEVPTVINYSLAQSTMTPLLSGTAQESGVSYAVTVLNLAGTYDRDSKVTTLGSNRVMAFTMSQRPANMTGEGPINIGISTPAGSTATWVSGEHPTAGTFVVTAAGYDQVTVQVNSGGTGVDLYVQGEPYSSLTWAAFESAVEDINATELEILASLAYSGLQAVYRCASQAYTVVEIVMKNQDTLAQSGLDVQLVTSLPGFPSNLHVQLDDKDGNKEVSPGDGFLTRFTNWWVDAPGTNTDHFYNGRLLWLDYWEGVNSSGNYVGGDFQFGVTGDEFYDDEVDGGVPDLGTRISYSNSGLQFILSW